MNQEALNFVPILLQAPRMSLHVHLITLFHALVKEKRARM